MSMEARPIKIFSLHEMASDNMRAALWKRCFSKQVQTVAIAEVADADI